MCSAYHCAKYAFKFRKLLLKTMKAILLVLFVIIGSVYCRSLPAPAVPVLHASSVIEGASVDANPAPIVRKIRQYGKATIFLRFTFMRVNS